jgi:hypothetical protein
MTGIEGEGRHGEPTPQPSTPTEQHRPQLEGDNGVPGIAPTLNERSKPPPEGTAQGCSERTLVLQPHPESPEPQVEPAKPKPSRLRPRLPFAGGSICTLYNPESRTKK